MTQMTATKMLSYANRRILPGEDFEAKSPRDRKVLLASRKAVDKRAEVAVPPPSPSVVAKIEEAIEPTEEDRADVADLAAARAAYKEATGKTAHWSWSAATVREKMNES